MKSIAKILLAVFSCAPFIAHAAPVSQTAGSNLTGYNGAAGAIAGNQWNNMTNPRQNAQSGTAKADFGNCNSLILRCASPKCSGGGCSDMNVAKPIVAGCVKSNSVCKKHGDDLIDAIAAQLVSNSVAAANRQNAEAAAAQNVADQNAQAMQQQMAQMTQQMQQMQQQNSAQIEALQNALEESQRANVEAQAAAQNAIATAVAAQPDQDSGLTKRQEAAAKAGVSEDVISRATITGQILSGLDGVDSALSTMQSNMRAAFEYAGCNKVNGNNCSGPKRVKKFRELAEKFFENYDSLDENLDDALFTAQSVGVDLGNIYMLFSGSCNRWAKYVCRGDYTNGLPVYDEDVERYSLATHKIGNETKLALNQGVQKALSTQLKMPNSVITYEIDGETRVAFTNTEREIALMQSVAGARDTDIKIPEVKKSNNTSSKKSNKTSYLLDRISFISEAYADDSVKIPNYYRGSCIGGKSVKSSRIRGGRDCVPGQVIPPEDLVECVPNEYLNPEKDDIPEAVLNPDESSHGSIRVGCASDSANGGVLKRRRSSKKGGGVDIDLLEIMIEQNEGDSATYDTCASTCEEKCNDSAYCHYCGLGSAGELDSAITKLRAVTVSKSLNSAKSNGEEMCYNAPYGTKAAKDVDCYNTNEDVGYIDPLFALCNTHFYNAGYAERQSKEDERNKVNEIIGLKTTVIAQQMYKQYSTLEALVKQFKTILQKEVLKAQLQVSGASSDDDDGDSSSTKVEFSKCSAIDDEQALSCLRSNYEKLQPLVEKGRLNTNYKKQLGEDCKVLKDLKKLGDSDCKACESMKTKDNMEACLEKIAGGINRLNKDVKKEKNSGNSPIVFYNPNKD